MEYDDDINGTSWVVREGSTVYGKNSKYDFIAALQERTLQYSVEILKLCDELPSGKNSSRIISYQLGKSASSTAANYRASCRARSGREFFSKISITVEEADETVYWLEVLKRGHFSENKNLDRYINEATEILKIVAKARSNSKRIKD